MGWGIRREGEGGAGKAECKAALQQELGFAVDAGTPLLGWIGRLDHQKGPDLVLDALPQLAARGCQVLHSPTFACQGNQGRGGRGGKVGWGGGRRAEGLYGESGRGM